MFEASKGIEWKPWKFKSRIMYRFGWLWFAFSWIRISYEEYIFTPTDFIFPNRTRVTTLEEYRKNEK